MKQLFTLLLLLATLSLFAQTPPEYDDCDGLYDLGVLPFCNSDVFFTNNSATPTDILPGDEAPTSCGNVGEPLNDVWFKFTAPDEVLDLTVSIVGVNNPATGETSIEQPVLVIYRSDGPCTDLQQYQCLSSGAGENSLSMDITSQLTPGLEYYLRVFSYSATGTPVTGAFQLCIEETVPAVNLCENITTTECSGQFFDCGGIDQDYSNNQNVLFTIAPPDAACVTLTFQYYNIEAFEDNLTFYDGPNTSSPVIGSINNGNGQSWGGACFSVSAPSGALTVQFTSDSMVTYEGWSATWECSSTPCTNPELLQITQNVTAQDVQETLTTFGAVITAANINCPETAYGLFDGGDNTDLGLNEGLVLTSGLVFGDDEAIGVTGIGNLPASFASWGHETPGDADLDYLSEQEDGLSSNDACIVEFEIFANTNEINFEYIFGSEEYPEFANSDYNDIFAFFISGPGIEGDPNINNKLNIATLPESTTPVQINSVNHENNWKYYRDNTSGSSVVFNGLTTGYEGVKKSLTAHAEVIPCNTYQLKLAVADRGDFQYDSGVFISEIKGSSPSISINFQNGIEYLVEECTSIPEELIINIGSPLENAQAFDVVISGTAEQDVDYTLNIPPTITFEAGETTKTYPIEVLTDGIIEGIEDIIIQLRANYGCGNVNLASLEIPIHDELNIEINNGADTLYNCAGGCVELEVTGANNYVWSPAPLFNPPNISNPTICPTQNQQVYVVGLLGACTAIDSIQLTIASPEIEVEVSDATVCIGEEITLVATNNVNNENLTWETFPLPQIIPNEANITLTADEAAVTYVASVSISGCTAKDSVTVMADDFFAPNIIPDTTICQGTEIALTDNSGSNNATIYTWTPSSSLMPNASVANPSATPNETTTYVFNAQSANNYCSEEQSVTLTVIPSEPLTLTVTPETVCSGETVQFNATSALTIDSYNWSAGGLQLSCTDCPNPSAVVNSATTVSLTAMSSTADCPLISNPVSINVIETPIIEPLEPVGICIGETATLNAGNTAFNLTWTDTNGTVIGNGNTLDVTPTETTTYTLTATNAQGDCGTATAEVTVSVTSETPTVEVTASDTYICLGDSVNISTIITGSTTNGTYIWTPTNPVSVSSGFTISPTESTTYSVTFIEPNCNFETSASVTVNVQEPFVIDSVSANPNELFQGDIINLTAYHTPSDLTNPMYNWIYEGNSVSQEGPSTSITAPTVEGNGNTVIVYEVTVTDEAGCTSTEEVTVVLLPFNFEVPNVFTPNNDMVNDAFRPITSEDSRVLDFKIYNRWGQLLYDNDNNQVGWNGTYKNEPVPADVYIYLVKYINAKGEEVIDKKDFTLIR